jgi:hypothetical protein
MKFDTSHRLILRSILDGSYTPYDVREFVQLCYSLALPLIRSKIARGKVNLDILGLKEVDVVYDCLADLFRRDSEGSFVQVKSYFSNHEIDLASCHEDDVLLALRRLVFGKVHNSVIRLYSDADPTLGKILRNVLLELEKRGVFELQPRFGEMCLISQDVDPCFHLPPITADYLRLRFSQVVSVRDSIPVMIEKLHEVLSMQVEYQRVVPLVTAALLFKEAYALGSDVEVAEAYPADQKTQSDDVARIADLVCKRLAAESRQTYVRKGKRSAEVFEKYMVTVKGILLEEFGAATADGSYYEHLKAEMPGLTHAAYVRRHRAILEYLAKQAKNQMREEIGSK